MHCDLKSAMVVIVLAVSLLGLTGCAKYPVVSDTRASSPSASASAPDR